MLDKELGKDIKLADRAEFLRDNWDGVEEMEYSKPFSPAEMAEWREKLATCDLAIADIEEEKAEAAREFVEETAKLAVV